MCVYIERGAHLRISHHHTYGMPGRYNHASAQAEDSGKGRKSFAKRWIRARSKDDE